jgi:hypothetical protein
MSDYRLFVKFSIYTMTSVNSQQVDKIPNFLKIQAKNDKFVL